MLKKIRAMKNQKETAMKKKATYFPNKDNVWFFETTYTHIYPGYH